MGTIFEELVRRFNEENNEEAGEHWTPRDAVTLMAKLVVLPIAAFPADRTTATPHGKRGLIYRGCSVGSFGAALRKPRARPRGFASRTSCGSGISTPRVAPHTPG